MLISVRLENFKSFEGNGEISLVAAKTEKSIPEASVPMSLPGTDARALLTAAAIYGPNASGKTNFLIALDRIREAIVNSQSKWKPDQEIPVEPHFLRSQDPTTIEVQFIIESVRYRYGVTARKELFIKEWLYSYPKGRERELFVRTSSVEDDDRITTQVAFGNSLSGYQRDFESSARRVRPNSLFLSSAAQDNQEECTAVRKWFSRSIDVAINDGGKAFTTATSIMALNYEKFEKLLLSLMKFADPSISSVAISYDGDDADLSMDLKREDFDKIMRGLRVKFAFGEEPESVLDFENESRGVKRLYALSSRIIKSLSLGTVAVIDELESSLHPHIAAQLVGLYQSKSSNPLHAQLIFTTHETRLLSLSHLRRDQIWFVEKTDRRSEIFSLIEFGPRKDLDLENSYMRGRFGAVPQASIPADWHEAILMEATERTHD